MRNRIVLVAAFAAFTFALSSCSSTGNSSNASKPANSNAGNSNAAKTGAKPPEPKDPIKSGKKPEGQQAKALRADRKVRVRTNWEYNSDPVKAYGFCFQAVSVGDSRTET